MADGGAASTVRSGAPRIYLALGDSLATGVQPIGDPDAMFQTAQGYPRQLLPLLREGQPDLELVEFGCPGESTDTFVGGGGSCSYAHGSQLGEAVAFLAERRGSIAAVSLDIGFNDFPCRTDLSCLPPGVERIVANLPGILASLREAAGPDVPIVGMTIYDPFLSAWFDGAEGRALAELSVWQAVRPVNDLLRGIYGAANMAVADVEAAFSTADFESTEELPGVGPVPRNVARICQWTWRCSAYADEHPNEAGYRAIALAYAAALGR